jgi:hypothetical protein
MSQFVGKWELVDSENFDEFLKAMDVNFVIRKTVAKFKSSLVITKEGDNWNIQTLSTFKNYDYKFVDGVEFIDSLLIY